MAVDNGSEDSSRRIELDADPEPPLPLLADALAPAEADALLDASASALRKFSSATASSSLANEQNGFASCQPLPFLVTPQTPLAPERLSR